MRFFFGLITLCLVTVGCSSRIASPQLPAGQIALAHHPQAKLGYELIYSFEGGAKGSSPSGPLLWEGGTRFLGTTSAGGDSHNTLSCGCGVAFIFNDEPPNYRAFYSFGSNKFEADGVYPPDGMTRRLGHYYAVTREGGASQLGAVVEVFTYGADRVKYSFTGKPDGDFPHTGLSRIGEGFYGTTSGGGAYDNGTVYVILASGDEQVLHSFAGKPDGAAPGGRLVAIRSAFNVVYGTTQLGGGGDCPSQCGTVYKLTNLGSEEVLYRFKDTPDGADPIGPLTEMNGKLYGVTTLGGTSSQNGTVFEVSPSGQERVIHSFGGGYNDGSHPVAGLVEDNGMLYGTTETGGAHNHGTLFKLNPKTGTETVLHDFAGTPDGSSPAADLIEIAGNGGQVLFYGTTLGGGAGGYGTIFKYVEQ